MLASPGDSRCIMAHEVPEYFALLIKTEEPGKILTLAQYYTARVRCKYVLVSEFLFGLW